MSGDDVDAMHKLKEHCFKEDKDLNVEIYTLFFFYKNKLYKNTQAEICPKIKNNLRVTRLKF